MLEQYRRMVEKRIEELIPSASPYYPILYEGARHIALAPAKRIRPLLTLVGAEFLKKGTAPLALDPACALELIHTYSLIHDDLPCMDDDDFRRGKPTLHRLYGEAHALLIGDYLLTYAFEILAKAPSLSSDQKVALIATLAHHAGGSGLIGGQLMDLESSRKVGEMQKRKTALLFKVALEFSGIISGANRKLMHALKTFGLQFGRLFQLVDDLFDEDHPLKSQQLKKSLAFYARTTKKLLAELPGDTAPLTELSNTLFDKIGV